MRDPDLTYTLHTVERLLGRHELPDLAGERDITIADIWSWAHDSGGSAIYHQLLLERDPDEAWMARRGPLDPESGLALVLWDFLRAMRELEEERNGMLKAAVIALTAMGFSPSDIAAVIDPGAVIELAERQRWDSRTVRTVNSRRRRIARMLEHPKRDSEGRAVKDDRGKVIYVTGPLVRRFARLMNDAAAPPKDEEAG